MSSTIAPRIDRRPAIGRAVQLDAPLASRSCRSATAARPRSTFGPMPTAHANGMKYGRPRRKWM